ncbi:amidase [Bradyrhizobium sp. 183]|uniref:amidase n=1 Tax=unclassified Bradyrhizobium TaxID=2631580 RepID=UPI001FFFFFDA|nr:MULTISPECIES: amidase [unclassified Bradyrhizobium]UPJ79306.1 amidase [Bradyrhizobium sp. 184]UPJ87100.1 amidase [Bradyrhizobium sp. 183]
MKQPYWLSATEITDAFRARRLSPVELLRSLLQRIEAVDAKVNAFTCLDAEMAMAQARFAEQEMSDGRSRGPLHGLPIAIKDNIDVAGLPTTCHSKILLENVPAADAHVVKRLRQCGMVILGKLATWEFASGGPSFDLPFPPARNPWNLDHQPGGSSSGSGAGLAAGLFPLALGTDTGGSVRHPSAACGVVGLKPTYGLVSRQGVFPLSFTLDNVGPMARNVADVAILLGAIAGHDPADPSSVAALRTFFHNDLERGVNGIRVGFVRNFHETDVEADPEVTAALNDAAGVLRNLGADVRDVQLPSLKEFAAVNRVILYSEAWSIHSKWLKERPGDYAQGNRRGLMVGAFISAGDYVAAQRRRNQLISAVDDVFRDVDVLLAANALDPAAAFPAQPQEAPPTVRQARTPFNVTGHPAISVMSGLSKSSLPLSMQLIGRAFDEAFLLRVAAAYERATNWSSLKPAI